MPRIESNTNQAFRRKYYVGTDKILSASSGGATRPQDLSQIIDSSIVRVSTTPVTIRAAGSPEADRINVETIRDGDHIKGIRIRCPCGRHTEFDVEYAPLKSGVQKQ